MKAKNLLQFFNQCVETRKEAPCLRYKEDGAWQTLNWFEVREKIWELAGGLKKLGVKAGDSVCLFSRSRYEWTLADMAILSLGAITVPIYESNTADQAQFILEDSEAKVVFVQDVDRLKKVLSVRQTLKKLKQIILIEGDGTKLPKDEGVYTFEEVLIMGHGLGQAEFETQVKSLTRDSECSYVYTSGTTGNPKGAVMTHGNFLGEVEGLKESLDFNTKFESLLFLPLAHILARGLQFAQLGEGFVQCYAESIDKLIDNIAETRPHIMVSVPRIFEKVYAKVLQGVEAGSEGKKKIFYWALEVGKERADRLNSKANLPLSLKIKWALAYKLVFSKLHERLGGRSEYFILGGAPLSPEIATFFAAAGFYILEGYGLTETTAGITCNTKDAWRIGTVGKPLPGARFKIAEDGEILVKGPMVFKGYFKRPDATQEAIDEDGWFHTGDIGVFDDEGFLKITDRKKDIIVTAAGKNIAPQNIENLIKNDPFISQVMVHGDKRKYLSALVTLNEDEAIRFAKKNQIPYSSFSELAQNKKLYHTIKSRIEGINKKLAKYETIKKFAILDQDFSVETGELTPTLKVKRKYTSEKYKQILDSFYSD